MAKKKHASNPRERKEKKPTRGLEFVPATPVPMLGARLTDDYALPCWLGKPPVSNPGNDLKSLRQQLGVKVTGAAPPPVEEFRDPALPEEFRTFVQGPKGSSLIQPTPIQMQVWPAVLSRSDLIGIAPTGSGKTLAYLLPAVPLLLHHPGDGEDDGSSGVPAPRGLILVPTRELALQIASTFRGAGGFTKLFQLEVASIVGGIDKKKQIQDLKKDRPEVVVATPGRLLDLQRGDGAGCGVKLTSVSYLVFDEADRMLALGFEQQLNDLAKVLSKERQTVLFSATFPEKLRHAAERWLKKGFVVVRSAVLDMSKSNKKREREEDGEEKQSKASSKKKGTDQEVPTAATGSDGRDLNLTVGKNVEQTVHVCASHKKPQKLSKWLDKIRAEEKDQGVRQKAPVLIFCNKIKTLQFLFEHLKERGAGERISTLHSQMSQANRESALTEFQAGRSSILLATDVAARGLHNKRLKYVVNYDFPSNLEQYCHRIGRAGRAGETGHTYSFLTRNLAPLAQDLITLLEETKSFVDPNLRALAKDHAEGDADDDAAPAKKKAKVSTKDAEADDDDDDDEEDKGMKDEAGKNDETEDKNNNDDDNNEGKDENDDAEDDDDDDDDDASSTFGADVPSQGGLRIKPRKHADSSDDETGGGAGASGKRGNKTTKGKNSVGPKQQQQQKKSKQKEADPSENQLAKKSKTPFKRPRGKRGTKNKKWW